MTLAQIRSLTGGGLDASQGGFDPLKRPTDRCLFHDIGGYRKMAKRQEFGRGCSQSFRPANHLADRAEPPGELDGRQPLPKGGRKSESSRNFPHPEPPMTLAPARPAPLANSSTDRRVGQECVGTCRSRWSPLQ